MQDAPEPTTGAQERATVQPVRDIDALIVGGGIAGLWLLNLLTRRGYGAILLEADTLGCQQTLASQGMIHGGLKYALSGNLTRASEAIASMPDRWAASLAGQGDVDLSQLQPLSDRYYMFAEASTLGQLTTFFASRALRGRIRKLSRAEHPPPFSSGDFRGVVYALKDFVVDTGGLLRELLRPVADRTYRHRVQDGELKLTERDARLTIGGVPLAARRLILTAGAGNQALLHSLGLAKPEMQRRPLHQVVVRHDCPHPLFAHCLTGIRRPEPRLTITSHRDGDGWLWYLGGQLATDGVDMTPTALIAHARRELETCLPWLSWRDARIETLRIDRAEPLQSGGQRPDEAFVQAADPEQICLVGWPTKLSLAPDLGDKILAMLPPPNGAGVPALDLPAALVGTAPWDH